MGKGLREASAKTYLAWTASIRLLGRAWALGLAVLFLAPGRAVLVPALRSSGEGAGSSVAFTYIESDVPFDPNYAAGSWDVEAALVDAATGDTVRGTVDEGVHVGAICFGPPVLGVCDPLPLDLFESALAPDGRLIVAFHTDKPENGKCGEVLVAVQTAGARIG